MMKCSSLPSLLRVAELQQRCSYTGMAPIEATLKDLQLICRCSFNKHLPIRMFGEHREQGMLRTQGWHKEFPNHFVYGPCGRD